MRLSSAIGVTLATAAVVAAMTTGTARADRTVVSDPNDASGRLDVRQVAHGHWRNQDTGETHLTHTLSTYERWRPRLLRSHGQIEFWFQVDSDPEPDRRLSVGVTKGSLYAEMQGDGRSFGFAKVYRPGPRSVKVQFPASLLGADGLTEYRWFARTGIVCDVGSDVVVVCPDEAPARGRRGNPGVPRAILHALG